MSVVTTVSSAMCPRSWVRTISLKKAIFFKRTSRHKTQASEYPNPGAMPDLAPVVPYLVKRTEMTLDDMGMAMAIFASVS
jgi:hypothetical protein